MTQIQQYFHNENACRRILRINAENVECLEPGDLLNNSIGKAINLVEVNLHGTRFKDIWQWGSFLKPLLHLVKLSIDWPDDTVEDDIGLYRQILQKPFSKLTYLSVNLSGSDSAALFTSFLSLCQQLKQLHIQVSMSLEPEFHMNFWDSGIKQLTNLKIVQYRGDAVISMKDELANMLLDPKRWTDFELCGSAYLEGFYIEKDVEVHEELLQSKRLQDFLNPDPWENFTLGWAVNLECLLKEVLRITHEDVPEKLCCLSTFVKGNLHLLKVEHVRVRVLEIEDWDLDALHIISGWKSLETLDICGIPIEDGQFLIEIGKQCKNLQTLSLSKLSGWKPCRYEDALFKMLQHCQKLRDFTVEQSHINQAELFNLLAKNVDLEIVFLLQKPVLNFISDWIQSFENLLRQCKKLTRVLCIMTVNSVDDCKQVVSAVERMEEEFHRPGMRIELFSSMAAHLVLDDPPDSEFLYSYGIDD